MQSAVKSLSRLKSSSRCGIVVALVSLVGLPVLAAPSSLDGAQTPAKPAPKPAQKPPQKPAQKPADKPEAKPASAPKAVALGEEVDGVLTLSDTEGKAHKLSDYRGKTVVLAMWSIDCATCKQYQERLKKLNDDYASKNVVVLAVDPNANEVDSGAEPYKRLKEYSSKNPLGATLVVDSGKLAERLGARSTPEVFVIDAKGMLRYKGAIDDDPKAEKADKANTYARKALDEMLAGKPVTTASTIAAGSAIKAAHKPDEKKPDEKKPEDKPAPPTKKG